MGLETGRRRDLPGRVEAGLHRTVLSSAGFQHDDGQSFRHAFLQDGQ